MSFLKSVLKKHYTVVVFTYIFCLELLTIGQWFSKYGSIRIQMLYYNPVFKKITFGPHLLPAIALFLCVVYSKTTPKYFLLLPFFLKPVAMKFSSLPPHRNTSSWSQQWLPRCLMKPSRLSPRVIPQEIFTDLGHSLLKQILYLASRYYSLLISTYFSNQSLLDLIGLFHSFPWLLMLELPRA